jgi:hypothetical protein
MNQFSNFLQSKKNFKQIVHPAQKGFKKNIEGCSEHAATLNFLIAHSIANKKSIYISTLDCRDAFGSVPHKLLAKNMENLHIPEEMRNLLMDSYDGASVNIFSDNSESRKIHIRRGVKQGCPLS